MSATASATSWVEHLFQSSIVPTLVDYIKIPNKSMMFDPEWRAHGYMDQATEMFAAWARTQLPAGATLEVVRLGERTPVIFIDVPGTGGHAGDTVMLYGHLDKQPEMTGWRDGLGPWIPVLEGDKLYGRGAADDGYALFSSLTAINVLRRDNIPHARCVVLIEACEESGSVDLPAYIEHLAPRIGQLSLVICLDSGCANYDQLWSTTSLRGLVLGTLEVSLLTEGVHSGDGTGVIAASERVIRQLLDRLDDSHTGQIKLAELGTAIPRQRILQAERTAQVLGNDTWARFPLQPGAEPITRDPVELILNRTWRPGLALTGADGWPPLGNAGNVLRPFTRLKLSIRIPPRVDPAAAAQAVKRALEKDPPYGAKVSFDITGANAGWDAPELAPWLDKALDAASQRHFGKPAMYMGEGGTIPFMYMLGEKFPKAQFCITGVLGPGSNAHGPNEFLHLPTARRLTLCVADVLAEHARQ
ncbi:MAG TPA: M20 family metallopeptidase [Kofleriaceae bacterium]|jgi:acetylornithine deacetylase/succinyl-diaminopimelate desuccinylase-like protein|nr:M20 family metallopeptidase [Kofleriaceae bacterium]